MGASAEQDGARRRRPGRPGFMGATVTLALLSTLLVGWLGDRLYDPREARASLIEDIDQGVRRDFLQRGFRPLDPAFAGAAVRRVAEQYRVELLVPGQLFELSLEDGPVSGAPPNEPELVTAVAVLAEELARYPSEFIQRSGLRRIIVCRALAENAMPIPSLPNVHRTLLLDVEASPQFLRRLVHHELFHFADFADDEQVRRDPEWERLNGHYFVYGPGGRFVRNPHKDLRGRAPAGFVTGYARSALEEDKAETFAFMLVEPGALRERCASDLVLAAKVAAIERQVHALSPAMDESFWQRGAPRSP